MLLGERVNSDPHFSSHLLPTASLGTTPRLHVWNGKLIFPFQAVTLIMDNVSVLLAEVKQGPVLPFIVALCGSGKSRGQSSGAV